MASVGLVVLVAFAVASLVVATSGSFLTFAVVLAVLGLYAVHRSDRSASVGAFLMAPMMLTLPWLGVRIGPLALSDLFLAVACIPIAVNLARRRTHMLAGYRSLIYPAAAIALASCIGAWSTTGISDQAFANLLKYSLSTVGTLTVVALWAPERHELRQLLWLVVLGAAISGVVAVFFEDLQYTQLTGRPNGLAGHPNHLGFTLVLAVGVAMGLLFTASRQWARLLAGASLVWLSYCVLVTGSRASLVALVATPAAYTIASRQWKAMAWGGGVVGGVFALIATGALPIRQSNAINRFLGTAHSAAVSDTARREFRGQAVEVINANPLFGIGFESPLAAHSLYLQIWMIAGLTGLVAFGVIVWKVAEWILTVDDPLAVGLLSSYTGYLLASLAMNALWDRYIWTHLALAAALAIRAPHRRPQSRRPSGQVAATNVPP